MEGGTTFHFITGGTEEALEKAKAAAGDKDVKIGGGVSTVRLLIEDELPPAHRPSSSSPSQSRLRRFSC
jgi:dihydrofolate reductase